MTMAMTTWRSVTGALGLLGAVGCGSLLAGGAAFAQGTEAQREACTPDAFRLCSTAMPDAKRVENCLRNAGQQLSPRCYAVFFPPAPQPDAAPPPGGRQPSFERRAPDRAPMGMPPPRPLPGMDDDDDE